MIQPVAGLAMDNRVSDIPTLARAYGNWSGIRSNHVITQDGKFGGKDGSSRSISTPEDRELLLELRSRADLVIVDAQTARSEKYKSPASGSALAIFSSSGNFVGIPAVENPKSRTLCFAPKFSTAISQPGLLEYVHIGNFPFEGFLEFIQDKTYNSMLLEAGPTLTKLAFEAKAVSQSALTFTPEFEGSAKPINPFSEEAKLISMANGTGASFTLWAL